MVLEFTSSHKVWKHSSFFMLTAPQTPDQMLLDTVSEVKLSCPFCLLKTFPAFPGHLNGSLFSTRAPLTGAFSPLLCSSTVCASSLWLCPRWETCPFGKTPVQLVLPCKPGCPVGAPELGCAPRAPAPRCNPELPSSAACPASGFLPHQCHPWPLYCATYFFELLVEI